MPTARRPWWQQATALVTVSTGGVLTGLNFVPGAAATMTSPTSVPLHLLALEQGVQPATLGHLAVGGDSAAAMTSDAQLRSAIVNVASYYLRLAKTRTPAQMEALIWDNTSSDGADHGESCAAFASLALELAAQAVGQQSWVTGGTSYPFPLPSWADVRVDTNAASPQITSLVADAQAHDRWHSLGDGYQPQPGDWAVYDGHVEVVTSYSNGVLDTIGSDSLPGLTVNAHSSAAPLAEQGVAGFVDNGNLKPSGTAGSAATPAKPVQSAASPSQPATAKPATHQQGSSNAAPAQGSSRRATGTAKARPRSGAAAIPGVAGNGVQPGGAGADPGAAAAQAGNGASGTSGRAASAHDAPGRAAHGTVSNPGEGHAPTGAIPGVLATGDLLGGSPVATQSGAPTSAAPSGTPSAATIPGVPQPGTATRRGKGDAAIPGAVPAGGEATTAGPGATGPSASRGAAAAPHRTADKQAPSTKPAPSAPASSGAPAAPGSSSAAPGSSGSPRHSTPGTRDQQAFISLVAPGAIAAQRRYGVPAAVTIAQAIEESAWGQSGLAAQYHNLFGIKGAGPAGSVSLPTSEYEGGRWVTIDAQFRVYHNDAESIADHAELLATSGYYTRAMADRAVPDAFANDLTGVYATDPEYGANLIALMKLYNLYQFDNAAGPATPGTPATTPTPTPSAAPTARPLGAPSGPSATIPANTATAPPHTTSTPSRGTPASRAASGSRSAVIPGSGAPSAYTGRANIPGVAGASAGTTAVTSLRRAAAPGVVTGSGIVTTARVTRARAASGPARYQPQLPNAVTTALFASAKAPLARGEHLYRDVAACTGVSWQLLAAVDWMECKADPRRSPVHGERLGSVNADGTSYPTRSAALTQCACDLAELAAAVYGIDVTAQRRLSVRELAAAFAAFRWGALLRRHGVSAMEFPYSVAGLTAQHQKMHWPSIADDDAPDRAGARFREPFGAVPLALSLDYPATV